MYSIHSIYALKLTKGINMARQSDTHDVVKDIPLWLKIYEGGNEIDGAPKTRRGWHSLLCGLLLTPPEMNPSDSEYVSFQVGPIRSGLFC